MEGHKIKEENYSFSINSVLFYAFGINVALALVQENNMTSAHLCLGLCHCNSVTIDINIKSIIVCLMFAYSLSATQECTSWTQAFSLSLRRVSA